MIPPIEDWFTIDDWEMNIPPPNEWFSSDWLDGH
tara:strand:+ start:952 stop:1053 length:102 start_codon:yes stop_codon:yes gene_type:complete